MEHYGGAHCYCCGVTELEFLTLDHIRGDGGSHRAEVAGGASGRPARGGDPYYRWLRRAGFPDDLGLRVACLNCNLSARNANGRCAHQRLQHALTGGFASRGGIG